MTYEEKISHLIIRTSRKAKFFCFHTQSHEDTKIWSRRIMETFSQIVLVTPRNQRGPLCQVSLFLRNQRFIAMYLFLILRASVSLWQL